MFVRDVATGDEHYVAEGNDSGRLDDHTLIVEPRGCWTPSSTVARVEH